MSRPVYVNDAITVDEVGIETGRYEQFLLKSAYQPVWLRRDDMLYPTAVEALIRPFVDGAPVPVPDLFAAVPEEDRFFIESLCRALHLRNHHNIGEPALELFFNYDPDINIELAQALQQLHYMADRLAEKSFDLGLLICEITEARAIAPENLVRIAAEMRSLGMRVAVDDFGSGQSTLERVELLDPDIIKIDGQWFRRVVSAKGASRLLGTLIASFKRRGASVLVEGIETPEQLAVAIEAGAERLQGYLLGRPALVGTDCDWSAKPIAHFLGLDGNVVPLASRRRS